MRRSFGETEPTGFVIRYLYQKKTLQRMLLKRRVEIWVKFTP